MKYYITNYNTYNEIQLINDNQKDDCQNIIEVIIKEVIEEIIEATIDSE